jgi:hypothetical protein
VKVKGRQDNRRAAAFTFPALVLGGWRKTRPARGQVGAGAKGGPEKTKVEPENIWKGAPPFRIF